MKYYLLMVFEVFQHFSQGRRDQTPSLRLLQRIVGTRLVSVPKKWRITVTGDRGEPPPPPCATHILFCGKDGGVRGGARRPNNGKTILKKPQI